MNVDKVIAWNYLQYIGWKEEELNVISDKDLMLAYETTAKTVADIKRKLPKFREK